MAPHLDRERGTRADADPEHRAEGGRRHGRGAERHRGEGGGGGEAPEGTVHAAELEQHERQPSYRHQVAQQEVGELEV